MEGSLSQQDGTSEKVAVKTMKREFSVTHEPILVVGSYFGVWCSMRPGWHSEALIWVTNGSGRHPERCLGTEGPFL